MSGQSFDDIEASLIQETISLTFIEWLLKEDD